MGVKRYTERAMGIYFKSRKILGTELYLMGLSGQQTLFLPQGLHRHTRNRHLYILKAQEGMCSVL